MCHAELVEALSRQKNVIPTQGGNSKGRKAKAERL
jgi:hypothetical protein